MPFEETFTEFGDALSGFIESDAFQIGIRVIVAYIVLIWLAQRLLGVPGHAAPVRQPGRAVPRGAAYHRCSRRSSSCSRVLLYRIVRPKETVAEANERALAEEAILAEIESRPHCANCSRAGARGMDHLPHLPQPAAPRLPQLQPPRRARLVAVRVVRQGLRARRGPRAPAYMPAGPSGTPPPAAGSRATPATARPRASRARSRRPGDHGPRNKGLAAGLTTRACAPQLGSRERLVGIDRLDRRCLPAFDRGAAASRSLTAARSRM